MKVTAITPQQRNPDRVNVSVDGKYRFSLDVLQVTDLGVKVGKTYNEEEMLLLEEESTFGKLYVRALEYSMSRPHSQKEMRDYLWRKTRTTKVRHPQSGEFYEKKGVSQEVADRVYERLLQKGYVNDESFAKYWIENRSFTKGASRRKLQLELSQKGVERALVDILLAETSRNDQEELSKVIAKKQARYSDQQKFIAYLMRQGFTYDDVKQALSDDQ